MDSRLLSCLRRPLGRFDTELLGVLRGQPLPAGELHRLATSHAADRSSAEKMIQNIESDVPPGGTHGDKAPAYVDPQRQARAAGKGVEFPAHVEATPFVLQGVGSVGSRDRRFGNVGRGRSHRCELHLGSHRIEVPIGIEGRPLAQLRPVG